MTEEEFIRIMKERTQTRDSSRVPAHHDEESDTDERPEQRQRRSAASAYERPEQRQRHSAASSSEATTTHGRTGAASRDELHHQARGATGWWGGGGWWAATARWRS